MTRTSRISALALALALGGNAAWGQERNAIDPDPESSITPMSPNCTRVPYFNELPQLLFSRNLPANACTGRITRPMAFDGSPPWDAPVHPALSLDRETASDQATQRILARLLGLWKTYYKEGRYQEAARVAQKALGLVPGNLAAEIALALARKHCCIDTVQSDDPASGPNSIKSCAGQCPNNAINAGGCGSSPAGATSRDTQPAGRMGCPAFPPCSTATPLGFNRPFVPGMTPAGQFATGLNCGPNAMMPPPFAWPGGPMPGCGPTVVYVPVPMPAVPPCVRGAMMPMSAPPATWPVASIVRTTAAISSPEAAKADIRVTATGKRVHIISPCLEAHCDHMTTLNLNGRVLLEGAVNIKFHMDGHAARIVGNRVIVGLTDGTFDIEPGPALVPTGVFSEPVLRGVHPVAVWRTMPPVTPEKPKSKTEPACPAASPSAPVFQSWPSFIR